MGATREPCSTCRKPIRSHTLDDAIDCNKAGYWMFLLKKGVNEGPTKQEKIDAPEAEA